MSATDVLHSAKAGDMLLIYPTYSTLKEIRDLHTTEEIENWAISHASFGVHEVLPAIIDLEAGKKVVLPGDPRYPEAGAR